MLTEVDVTLGNGALEIVVTQLVLNSGFIEADLRADFPARPSDRRTMGGNRSAAAAAGVGFEAARQPVEQP